MNSHFKEPHIAVLVDTATGWGRRLVQGIINYSKLHGSWNIWIRPKGQNERHRLPVGWQGDGVIARISTPGMLKHLIDFPPVVNVSAIRLDQDPFARVTTDAKKAIEFAIQHFLDCGHRNFGYCSVDERSYIAYQRQLFKDAVQSRGFECHIFQPNSRWQRSSWESRKTLLREWLLQLPKPIGIHTWATTAGVDLISACQDEGIRVPDEVAVLGGDFDDLICEACQPPLSGLAVPAEQIGYEAATLLARIMSGEKNYTMEQLIEPTGVVERVSTDVVAVDDQELVDAIRFIRRNASRPLTVETVVNEIAVSRRLLERRFRALLGRSIHDEIARVHMDRAKLLLVTTEMPIPQVATSAGFNSPEYFTTVFRKTMKTSPLKYRARLRGQTYSGDVAELNRK